MPRAPRLDTLGALHHVIVRGIERSTIFRDDTDRTDFLDRIRRLFPETGTVLLVESSTRPNIQHSKFNTQPFTYPLNARTIFRQRSGSPVIGK